MRSMHRVFFLDWFVYIYIYIYTGITYVCITFSNSFGFMNEKHAVAPFPMLLYIIKIPRGSVICMWAGVTNDKQNFTN